MNIYAIIPARGGSKSIPKKNIKLLNGRPLIAYSIDYAKNCKLINETIVSTDSKEIALIAQKLGAITPFQRPSIFALDDTPDFPVINHALLFLEKTLNKKIDLLVLLRPTSPLRPSGLIEKSIELLKKFPEGSSVRSVTKSKENPYRQWKLNGNFIEGCEKSVLEPYNLPRQKLPEFFFQTGDIEVIRRETLINGSISGKNVIPIFVRHSDMVDIDVLDDLDNAKERIKKLNNEE